MHPEGVADDARHARWSLLAALPVALLLLAAPERLLLFSGAAGIVALLAHALLAYSAWSLLCLAITRRPWPSRAMWPLALWMAAGLVARRLYQPEEAYGATLALPYLATVAGIALQWRAPRVAPVAGVLAITLPLGWLAWEAQPGAVRILLLTAGAVTALLLAQHYGTRFAPAGRLRLMGLAPALAIVGAQAWDGTVTYLSVVDPLGWSPAPLVEQIPVSRWILEHTGPGFVAVKVALGATLAYVMAPRTGWQDAGRETWSLHGLVVFISLVPAAFSTSNLLLQ